ncbi:MAG TPA: hypothetical protein ENO29_07415 [Candidatus Aminicenantes bacterium]|nr:MAG: hypothetical protein C0168_00220 [Candidatus Aminicenantes bacterium]HEK86164.1 hypothetical protein [Candidatus Aminicenantes bacterium]
MNLIFGKSKAETEYLAGYLIIPVEKVDKSYNAGFSMYVPAWPLLTTYPGHLFQSGLPSTWMFAQYDGPAPKKMYSDIEGGLGWWRETRFPTETPKFIMGGVGPNFSEIANGPGNGWGAWGLYGVAQLSPYLLFPLDGLNIKQGASGELLGYGYLPLPLGESKKQTDGRDIPTGNQFWTLFLNANNFKGPVAFFTPYFWSKATVKEPRLAGQLLDSRPSDPNRAVEMETQYIPCRIAVDSKGESYARIAPVLFPRNAGEESILVHKDTVYNRKALWDSVAAWFSGGPPCDGAINPEGALIRNFVRTGRATWEIRISEGEKEVKKIPIDWNDFAQLVPIDSETYGLRWNYEKVKVNGPFVILPEYYHLENAADPKKARWVPIAPDKVPAETGLQKLKWDRPAEPEPKPCTTPDSPKSCWKKPGPVAGPFQAYLGDGTVLTYYWYRFADQPALLNAGLTDIEREQMQAKIEKIHRSWSKDGSYLQPPSRGKLVDLDPALIVTPPKGLEVGYVPIVTRQELRKK